MQQTKQKLSLTRAILFTGETFVEGHSLLIDDGHVVDIVRNGQEPDDYKPFKCDTMILAPGFIDCQLNGGGGLTFNDLTDSDSVLKAVHAHIKCGVTSVLPSITTDPKTKTYPAIDAVRAARKKSPAILGMHLEGPHISVAQKGAHKQQDIRPLDAEDLAQYMPREGEIVKLTVAPETVPPAQIKELVEKGFIISLGHSGASPALLREAVAAGATNFTHLFNAMGSFSARNPGPAGTALDLDNTYTSIIADGRHVCPEMLRLAFKAKAADRLFLVSDAIAPAGAGDFMMDKPDTDEVLTGAYMTLGEIVSYAIRELKFAPEQILRMASTVPAAFLGKEKELGKLEPGYRANIVGLDHFFRASKVWLDGALI